MNADDPNLPAFMNPLSVMYGEGKSDPENNYSVNVQEAKRYIVTDLSENANGYDLTLAEYAEAIYTDSEIKDIPQRQSDISSAPPVVFSDQQRNEQQLILDALREMTNPQNVDRIASQVFDREFEDNIGEAVGEKAPRFRGVYYQASAINTAVNNKVFNINDYIYFGGENSGTWHKYFIYQWTGANWAEIPQPSQSTAYGWMYLNAVNSIAEGMPSSAFSNVFCQALTAATAFIENLFTHNINVFPNGSIKVENFTDRDGNVKGFFIGFKNGQGLIETNNMRTKGMDAVDATVQGTLVAGDAWDINGVENPLSEGGILFKKRPQQWNNTDSGVNLKNAALFGDTVIGISRSGIRTTWFYGRRRIADNEAQLLRYERRIEGNYSSAELYALLDTVLSGLRTTNDYFFSPINGAIKYDNGQQNQGHQSVMCYVNAITIYELIFLEIQGTDNNADSISGRFAISSGAMNSMEIRRNNSLIFTVPNNVKMRLNIVLL
jgi:hypothetical protein